MPCKSHQRSVKKRKREEKEKESGTGGKIHCGAF
jgi:hypothetical protein